MTQLFSGTLGDIFLGPTNKLNPAKTLIQGAVGADQPKPVTAPTVIVPPPPDSGVVDQGANVQAQADALRQRQGRAANLLTGSQGVTNVPVGTKTLTGQ